MSLYLRGCFYMYSLAVCMIKIETRSDWSTSSLLRRPWPKGGRASKFTFCLLTACNKAIQLRCLTMTPHNYPWALQLVNGYSFLRRLRTCWSIFLHNVEETVTHWRQLEQTHLKLFSHQGESNLTTWIEQHLIAWMSFVPQWSKIDVKSFGYLNGNCSIASLLRAGIMLLDAASVIFST